MLYWFTDNVIAALVAVNTCVGGWALAQGLACRVGLLAAWGRGLVWYSRTA